tara:strand:+ start:6454 stop:6774 length:321 start_codon:yes stop_codon:yes gene_type:complete
MSVSLTPTLYLGDEGLKNLCDYGIAESGLEDAVINGVIIPYYTKKHKKVLGNIKWDDVTKVLEPTAPYKNPDGILALIKKLKFEKPNTSVDMILKLKDGERVWLKV